MMALYIIIGLFLNLFLAILVFSIIDINEELYNWLWNEVPKPSNTIESMVIWILQFLVITLWPITIYIYLTRK